jgi:hypothetical protein
MSVKTKQRRGRTSRSSAIGADAHSKRKQAGRAVFR